MIRKMFRAEAGMSGNIDPMLSVDDKEIQYSGYVGFDEHAWKLLDVENWTRS